MVPLLDPPLATVPVERTWRRAVCLLTRTHVRPISWADRRGYCEQTAPPHRALLARWAEENSGDLIHHVREWYLRFRTHRTCCAVWNISTTSYSVHTTWDHTHTHTHTHTQSHTHYNGRWNLEGTCWQSASLETDNPRGRWSHACARWGSCLTGSVALQR